jgi:hypothetical protein
MGGGLEGGGINPGGILQMDLLDEPSNLRLEGFDADLERLHPPPLDVGEVGNIPHWFAIARPTRF